MKRTATVIGSGPNGLAAAIVLAQADIDVEVRETAPTVGGGVRTAELTLPGFLHDIGSAVYPMAVSSPLFSALPLAQHGLEWVWSPAELAHPFDDGTAVLLHRNVAETAAQFGADAHAYRQLFEPLARNWTTLFDEVFRPLCLPHHPLLLARFGIRAIQPATLLSKTCFRDRRARAVFAGLAAHSTLTLEEPLSGAFGLIMGGSAHGAGWPIARGGSQNISDSLSRVLRGLGAHIVTNARVASLDELGPRDLILCDVSPRGFLELAGSRLPLRFRRSLARYEYSPGVFKVDWALKQPIPWRAKDCSQAITVHLGASLKEIAAAERAAWHNQPPRNPFVLLAQPTLFDPSRAPDGQHTVWGYCHVPNAFRGSMLSQMEAQIERFAPGFRECVLARAIHTPADMQAWNENLVGGDISGGAPNWKQFALRPTWRRYATPLKGVFLCSSSTPPGGGVHGMCGYHAAQWALAYLRDKIG